MSAPAENNSPEYVALMREIAETSAALRADRIRDPSIEGYRRQRLEDKRLARLKFRAYQLRYPRTPVCPECGRSKTPYAQYCSSCRTKVLEETQDRDALASFRSEESRRLLALRPGKRRDRHARAFRRWRRWRRKHVHTMMGAPAQGRNACACGDYKELCAKMCNACQDAKNILKRRIQLRGHDNRGEPPISRDREPRVLRLLTPGIYESDPGCGWDDIIKIVENNR